MRKTHAYLLVRPMVYYTGKKWNDNLFEGKKTQMLYHQKLINPNLPSIQRENKYSRGLLVLYLHWLQCKWCLWNCPIQWWNQTHSMHRQSNSVNKKVNRCSRVVQLLARSLVNQASQPSHCLQKLQVATFLTVSEIIIRALTHFQKYLLTFLLFIKQFLKNNFLKEFVNISSHN